MNVSMNMPFYNAIAANGAKDALERLYKDVLAEKPIDGFDITLTINLQKLDEQKEQKVKDELINRISCLKANVLGGVFDYYFTPVVKGDKTPLAPFSFNLRSDTIVYFCPNKTNDRCTVIFSLDFKEKTDKAIAKIFMQEFVEAKRATGLGAAPPCAWGTNPPAELAAFGIDKPTGNLGFISFAVLKSNLDKDKKDKAIAVLVTFRNYMQYHIKCSKSYFHSRMRARVVSLLTILNRAKFEVDPSTVAKKTMGGKTFVKK